MKNIIQYINESTRTVTNCNTWKKFLDLCAKVDGKTWSQEIADDLCYYILDKNNDELTPEQLMNFYNDDAPIKVKVDYLDNVDGISIKYKGETYYYDVEDADSFFKGKPSRYK